MSYTPGPWKSVNRGRHVQAPRRSTQYMHDIDICEVKSAEMEHAGEAEANARLIAAAPELVEALQAALSYFDMVKATKRSGLALDACWKARAALAKAGLI